MYYVRKQLHGIQVLKPQIFEENIYIYLYIYIYYCNISSYMEGDIEGSKNCKTTTKCAKNCKTMSKIIANQNRSVYVAL